MRRGSVLFLCMALTLAACHPAQKTTQYPSGTIGYLIEDCRAALQKSSPEEILETQCNQVIGGYMLGAYVAAMRNHSPRKENRFKTTEACKPLIDKAQQKMTKDNGTFFCFRPPDEKIPDRFYQMYLIANWEQWLEDHDKDMLGKPLLRNITGALDAGSYCRHMAENTTSDSHLRPNDKLLNISGKEWHRMEKEQEKSHRPEASLWRESCPRDIEKSGNDVVRFSGTECGIYVSAFLSGALFTAVKEKITDPSELCSSELDRFYKYEVLAEDMCLPENLDVLDFARKAQTGDASSTGYCEK